MFRKTTCMILALLLGAFLSPQVQADQGSFDVPAWDEKSLLKVRNALAVLASTTSDT